MTNKQNCKNSRKIIRNENNDERRDGIRWLSNEDGIE